MRSFDGKGTKEDFINKATDYSMIVGKKFEVEESK
jgi:hypothetical protein